MDRKGERKGKNKNNNNNNHKRRSTLVIKQKEENIGRDINSWRDGISSLPISVTEENVFLYIAPDLKPSSIDGCSVKYPWRVNGMTDGAYFQTWPPPRFGPLFSAPHSAEGCACVQVHLGMNYKSSLVKSQTFSLGSTVGESKNFEIRRP